MIIDALISPNQSLEHQTLIMLRLPRAVIAILAGGALAASGVILQTLTKTHLLNPVQWVFILVHISF